MGINGNIIMFLKLSNFAYYPLRIIIVSVAIMQPFSEWIPFFNVLRCVKIANSS